MIAIIPAKTHSQRCPNKNWRPFAGSTLVNIAIHCAFDAGFVPIVIGDEELRDKADCDAQVFVRPRELPDDSWAVAEWATRNINDAVLLLQPTSPLRTVELVESCVAIHKMTGAAVTSWHNGKPSGAVYIREYGKWHEQGILVPDANQCDIDTEADFSAAELAFQTNMRETAVSSIGMSPVA